MLFNTLLFFCFFVKIGSLRVASRHRHGRTCTSTVARLRLRVRPTTRSGHPHVRVIAPRSALHIARFACPRKTHGHARRSRSHHSPQSPRTRRPHLAVPLGSYELKRLIGLDTRPAALSPCPWVARSVARHRDEWPTPPYSEHGSTPHTHSACGNSLQARHAHQVAFSSAFSAAYPAHLS